MDYSTKYDSPVGGLTLASDGENLTGLWLDGQKYHAATIKNGLEERADLPVFQLARAWLDRYFAGGNPPIDALPLSPSGSEFRQKVWRILCQIPYGTCITYGDIAKEIAGQDGIPRVSAQAVGGAVGHNPISIIIPCHRVVGSTGSLTGYAGGIDKKIWLLNHEGMDMQGLFIPVKGTAL